MISREEALVLINKYLKNKNNIKISLSTEAILKKIAQNLNEDEELWSLTGLLFNIDYEYTENDKQNRGILSSQILGDLLPEDGINAIKANNYINTDILPVAPLDKALISSESAIKLVIDASKSISSKKVTDVDIDVLIEKFKDSYFTSDNSKSRIKLCIDNGFEIEEFLNLVLDSIKDIAEIIGL
jgi:predicted hydrolase (HD superfamily)